MRGSVAILDETEILFVPRSQSRGVPVRSLRGTFTRYQDGRRRLSVPSLPLELDWSLDDDELGVLTRLEAIFHPWSD
jgi:hypothetical protein